MTRTYSFLTDVGLPDIWVVDPQVQYIEDIKPLRDTEVLRVRGMEGIAWAVPMYKGSLRARLDNGTFQSCVVIGLDDETERMMRSMPMDLSGGQQQRVAIARALVHNPRLIVCDEPTSALDGETGRKVMELMRRLAVGKDRALIVVTHDARIFEFADRIAQMEDGRITEVLNSQEHPNENLKKSKP
jgi:putative ABC transport system ATP-binding protein